jgi:hypothetical protein
MAPILDGRSWKGWGSAYGAAFHVEFTESQQHPGYYWYALLCGHDSFYHSIKRPFKADALQSLVPALLNDHGLVVGDLEWQEVPASKLILLLDRVCAKE